MSGFCKQCSIERFGVDHKDFVDLTPVDKQVAVICEGCGGTYVNQYGECLYHGTMTAEECLRSGQEGHTAQDL
jgi:hypothetical protein